MVQIRKVKEEDCIQVLSLLTELQDIHSCSRPDIFKKGHAVMSEREFERILEDENRLVLVAEYENQLAGMIEIEIKEVLNPILVNRKVGLINSFIVKKSMRKKGIGQSLFDEAIKWVEERNVDALELNVWGFNEPALHFYEKNGMQVLRTTMEMKLFHVKQ